MPKKVQKIISDIAMIHASLVGLVYYWIPSKIFGNIDYGKANEPPSNVGKIVDTIKNGLRLILGRIKFQGKSFGTNYIFEHIVEECKIEKKKKGIGWWRRGLLEMIRKMFRNAKKGKDIFKGIELDARKWPRD